MTLQYNPLQAFSPCLRTPSGLFDMVHAPNVHLSASPMRSFHLTNRGLRANRALPLGGTVFSGQLTLHHDELMDDSGFQEENSLQLQRLSPALRDEEEQNYSKIETPSKGIRVGAWATQ